MTWILHFHMNHSTISTKFGLGKSHSVDRRHCYGPKNLNLNTHLEIIDIYMYIIRTKAGVMDSQIHNSC